MFNTQALHRQMAVLFLIVFGMVPASALGHVIAPKTGAILTITVYWWLALSGVWFYSNFVKHVAASLGGRVAFSLFVGLATSILLIAGTGAAFIFVQ
jgi:hypothetical protein